MNKTESAEVLLENLRTGKKMTQLQQISLAVRLSIPAILAQLSSIVMQYIDASMVGRLGAGDSAAIGLVSTTTWLFGGLCSAAVVGFSVQVAQLIGAGREEESRHVLKQALCSVLLFCMALLAAGLAVSRVLPEWLGGEAAIRERARSYFTIFILSLPALQINYFCASMLRSSGNMKTPGMLNILMCFLDVCFNAVLIFPGHHRMVMGREILIPGFGLGVAGAALGTALSELTIALCMFFALSGKFAGTFFLPDLISRRTRRGYGKISRETCHGYGKISWRPRWSYIRRALHISLPVAAEQIAVCGAMIASTRIVAPLGAVSLAANSFAVTAESLCYMPGYGIGEAATTLVGQSIGAGRKDMTRRLARTTVFLGMAVMTGSGILMFFAAPLMFALLTPDPQICALGVKVLRIEAFAEPLYAASIVVSGALRGAGDTLIPGMMNLVSMWGVRLTLAVFLAPGLGLTGVWIAMCAELCFRGTLFLIRLFREKWLRNC